MYHKTLCITLLGTLAFSAQSASLMVERMTITSGSVVFFDPNYGIAGCRRLASPGLAPEVSPRTPRERSPRFSGVSEKKKKERRRL